MNFELTPEQAAFRDAVRGFAEKHLREGALARAHSPDHPWDVARLMAKQGLLGISDRAADLISEGIDCVIRGGALIDSSMKARKLCDVTWGLDRVSNMRNLRPLLKA